MSKVKKHADASPSSSSIWIACPASVTKARGRKRKPTVYTTEGTAAHFVAEALLEGFTPAGMLKIDGIDVTVTPEMIDHGRDYADYVRSRISIGSTLGVEMKVHIDVEGEDLWGTADAAVFTEPLLEVIDYKYGQGVAVDADSSQLRIYALGVVEEIGPFVDIDEVRMTIVQPRGGGIKHKSLPLDELMEWKEETLKPAVARLVADDQTETPGDHCRWCVRSGECEALAQLAQTNAQVAFGDLPPDPTGMTNDELGARLDYGEMILAWVNKMRAEASGRIDNGGYVPGWKLVPKRASRRWNNGFPPFEVMKSLSDSGLRLSDITRLETIGNLERAVKRHKLDPNEVLYPFTIKESSGTTLVSEKDGREAVDTSAKNVFSDLDPFEIGSIH